jgi:hypothetical protein
MANKDKMLNLPWQIGREFTLLLTFSFSLCGRILKVFLDFFPAVGIQKLSIFF